MRKDPFDPRAAHNDKVFICHYDQVGEPFYVLFSFGQLPAGSAARGARVAEYERMVEALKGQGCDVHVFDPEYWARGCGRAFLKGRYRNK